MRVKRFEKLPRSIARPFTASYTRSTGADLYIARNTETEVGRLTGWTSLWAFEPLCRGE